MEANINFVGRMGRVARINNVVDIRLDLRGDGKILKDSIVPLILIQGVEVVIIIVVVKETTCLCVTEGLKNDDMADDIRDEIILNIGTDEVLYGSMSDEDGQVEDNGIRILIRKIVHTYEGVFQVVVVIRVLISVDSLQETSKGNDIMGRDIVDEVVVCLPIYSRAEGVVQIHVFMSEVVFTVAFLNGDAVS